MVKKIDIDQPKWDQSNYQGRAKHFLTVTNPLNLLASNRQLERAREIVHGYKKGQSLKALGITEDELWKAKYLYDSAFHPDTGEKMILVGRMSAQVPMNMTITGCMLTFYRSTPAVIFWQWVNQSFNAIVNYTNRSGKNPIPVETLGWSYVGATTGAVVTALGLNKVATRFPPLVGRLVPLCAVAAANCVNIPMMRYTEIKDGIELQNEKGEVVGRSRKYAVTAISLVAVSRIMMAVPGMTLGPVVMNYLDKKCFMVKYPWSSGPIQMLLCGFCLTFATPLACAVFAQRRSVKVDHLEPEVRDQLKAKHLEVVYYNKGL